MLFPVLVDHLEQDLTAHTDKHRGTQRQLTLLQNTEHSFQTAMGIFSTLSLQMFKVKGLQTRKGFHQCGSQLFDGPIHRRDIWRRKVKGCFRQNHRSCSQRSLPQPNLDPRATRAAGRKSPRAAWKAHCQIQKLLACGKVAVLDPCLRTLDGAPVNIRASMGWVSSMPKRSGATVRSLAKRRINSS